MNMYLKLEIIKTYEKYCFISQAQSNLHLNALSHIHWMIGRASRVFGGGGGRERSWRMLQRYKGY